MLNEMILPVLMNCAKPAQRWLEGFAKPVAGFQHTMVYTRHDRDLSARAQKIGSTASCEACAWMTAPAPRIPMGKTLTFLWEAGFGSCNGAKRFHLLVNGKQRFTFRTLPDWHWTLRGGRGSALSFLAVFADSWPDLYGYMILTIPTAWTKPGQPLQLRIVGAEREPTSSWVVIYEYPDALAYFRTHECRSLYQKVLHRDDRAVTIKLMGQPSLAGKTLFVCSGERTLARGKFKPEGKLAVTNVTVPWPRRASDQTPPMAWVNGQAVEMLDRVPPPAPTASPMSLNDEGDRVFRFAAPTPYPDNDRLFLIDHLFTTYCKHVQHWRIIPGTDCGKPQWCQQLGPTVRWEAGGRGSTLTLRGEVEADLEGFTALRIHAMAAKSDTVRIRAQIDGQWRNILSPHRGRESCADYSAPIRGRHLDRLEVVFTAGRAGITASAVQWVGLVKPGKPTRSRIPNSAWTGLMADRLPANPQPGVGLLFDSRELAWLRRALHTPPLRKLWSRAIREASATLHGVRQRSTTVFGPAGAFAPEEPVAILAYVGLVERRADMLIEAARQALVMAHRPHWGLPLEQLKGIPFIHGRFSHFYACHTAALLLDWCADALTEAGRQTLAEAIYEKGIRELDIGLPSGIYASFSGNNQSVWYAQAQFAGMLAVRPWYPREFKRREAIARWILRQYFRQVIKPDGVMMEGTAYWPFALFRVPILAHLLSRASGKPMASELPPEIAASIRWALVNLRTDTDRLHLLPHQDGIAREIGPGLIAFFAGGLNIRAFNQPARQAYPASLHPLYLLFMKNEPAASGRFARTAQPALTVFRAGGQVDIRQPDPTAGMRIYFISGEWGCKSHLDKNSLILEAFGRLVLADRNKSSYEIPSAAILSTTEAHNVVMPDDVSQTYAAGKPGAILLRAEERDSFVLVESDAAPAWPGLARQALRRLIHWRPATLVVEDILKWTRPVVTHQYWQSRGPWKRRGNEWVTAANGVELSLQVVAGPDIAVCAAPFSVDADSLDYKIRPIYRLDIATPRLSAARIVTVMRVRQRPSDPWPITAQYDRTNDMLRLRMGNGQEHRITWRRNKPKIDART